MNSAMQLAAGLNRLRAWQAANAPDDTGLEAIIAETAVAGAGVLELARFNLDQIEAHANKLLADALAD